MKKTASAFGYLLRHYRRWVGCSVERAAEKAGFKDASIWSRYETGDRQPPKLPRTLHSLARAIATQETPESTKYHMLCRSAGYYFLLPAPTMSLLGLPRYLAPEAAPSSAYLQINSGKDRGALGLVESVAGAALQRVRNAGLSNEDMITDLDAVVEQAFGLTVRRELLDDAFAAFVSPERRLVLVNPILPPLEARQAVGHELAHMLLREAGLARSELHLDVLFGSHLFESPQGEKVVNWLAAAVMIPHPLQSDSAVDLSIKLVEDLSQIYHVPPELALCRLCFQELSDRRLSLRPEQAVRLVHRYPRIVYYW